MKIILIILLGNIININCDLPVHCIAREIKGNW